MTTRKEEIVLIVEDDSVMRAALKEILELEGFQVLDAPNGQEALAIMASTIPDVVLSDISMPEMDGITFFHRVREHVEWISIPFIFLTARGERDQILLGRDMGAEEYLVKPIMPDELLTTLRARLVRSRQLRLVQLRDSYEASLTMLANAIEVRDEYTRGHVERVTMYAVTMAQEIMIEDGFLEAVRFGAILHDIGKIHIRESILCKPTSLTESEWAEMHRHPQIGAEMIKDIPYLARAIPAVRHHHERWDGQGYPSRLSGEEIPLPARIVAVADSFDTMTTNRPYRQALPTEVAYDEIVNNSGKHYDPRVVHAFQSTWTQKKFLINFGYRDQ